MNVSPVFPSSYLAPIEYYHYLMNSNDPVLDVFENYVKQTYRNRCCILSPNGVQNLSVPLIKARKKKLIKDVKISFEDNWRKLHWKSLEAAYRSSPYFEFYEDDFYPFYHEKEYTYLIDLNWDLEQKIIELLQLPIKTEKSEQYINKNEGSTDFRTLISPKSTINHLLFTPYIQVFGDRNGFAPNLSILDILFNQGPNTVNYLKEIKPLTNV